MNGIKNEGALCRRASSAAALDIPMDEAVDNYIIQEIGPKPTASDVPNPPNTTAFRRELAKAEEALTKHLFSPQTLYAMLTGLIIIEALGLSLLLESMGWENPSRTIFGIMCAAAVIGLTCYITHLGATRTPGATGNQKTRWLLYAAIVVYAIVVLAITVLRAEGTQGSEESSRIYNLSAAIIMMCSTIGPAWLAERFMRYLEPMIPLIRARALNRRRIADAQRDYDRSFASTKDATARAVQWQYDSKRIGAAFRDRYNLVHKTFHKTSSPKTVRIAGKR